MLEGVEKRVKATVRAVLPEQVVRVAEEAYAEFRFRAVGTRSFPPERLALVDAVRLREIFADPGPSRRWEEDARAIEEVFGSGERVEGVNVGDRRALYHLVGALEPQHVLEVGTLIGASTVHIARALRALDGDRRLTTVDINDVNDGKGAFWQRQGLERSPRDNVARLDCSRHVRFVTAPSLAFMAETEERYDLVFLDGDHAPAAVYAEVAAAIRVLRPGGLILLHDYYPDGKPLYPDSEPILGPWRAGQRIMREQPNMRVLPLGELPWETKDGVRWTTLAIVTRSVAA